ncbi:MAG: methionine adenosyltransferase [Candidatus Micrarchaeia archaeon]
MANVHYKAVDGSVENDYVELVERKGLGHPDSVIDGIMEEISKNLCKKYLEEFGVIMHHNVDKGLVVGGEAKVEFGGGVVERPIEIYMAGRAVYEVEKQVINVEGIAMDTARNYLQKNFRNLNVDEEVVLLPRIRRGSVDLVDLFKRKGEIPLANDTSFGTGFAPYSTLESIVLETEQYLNSEQYKRNRSYVGEDIKVMGLREGNKIKITVAMALVSKHVNDLKDYAEKKGIVQDDIAKFISKMYDGEVEIFINTADDYKTGSVYITKTGLSMENGDDGEVGRGNRASGLITPYRKTSIEAVAGKNPVNHVGKIYNVLSCEICKDIVAQFDSIDSASFTILSQIGRPINEPKSAELEVVMSKGYSLDDVRPKLQYLVEGWLENITEITERILYGKARIF